jgi:hypothetical protein
MAAHGEVDPAPDCAIFADTQWEPAAVYEHLAWLRSPNVLPFPVHIVTAGSIRESIRKRENTTGGRFAAIPWHTVNPDGSIGLGRRQCSSEYKLEPIMRGIRRLLGKGMHDRIPPGSVNVLIGISLDEAHRMKPARQAYMVNRWPLVEQEVTREDCLDWLEANGYPRPPKSACIGCPFHGRHNDYWREMRDHRPDEWADAVEADRELRSGAYVVSGLRATCYMHPDRVPLDQVELGAGDRHLDGFGNECEGLCGV